MLRIEDWYETSKEFRGCHYLLASAMVASRQTDPGRRNGQTRCGYGSRLPTSWEVQLPDKRWRRVRYICYSNVGTAYVTVRGLRLIVDEYELDRKLSA